MQFRGFRLRFSRRLHVSQRQVEGFGQEAERQIERHFFKRVSRLVPVRRFVIGWLALVLLLIGGVMAQNLALSGYYQQLKPVPGGIYNEGVLGTFTTANPLYATNEVDTTVSHLLFAGLFSYNDQNQLVGNLASGYTVDPRGTTYTVTLKPHLTWQDGQPLTSQDVVFTYHLIQDPDAQSPLQNSWQGITVSAPNPNQVVFKLPDVLASFPYTMTNGIVPQHVLVSTPVTNLRSADFNTVNPIGSGPFAWQGIQVSGDDPTNAQEQIALTPFAGYQGGKPKLQEFTIHAYASQDQLTQAFKAGQLNGVEGLQTVPSALTHMSGLDQHNLMLTAGTYVFFKTSSGVLSDKTVRQALVQGANVPGIITNLGYLTRPVREPLLEGQLAYNPGNEQAPYNLKAAQTLLDQAGWVVGAHGIRTKNNQPLTFMLTATDTPTYRVVTKELQSQWRQLGVNMQIQLQPETDFTNTLAYHEYDAVLYGISIGIDPDVFVYWDSSQADIRSANRLNLSEYSNPTADEALESGRTRLDPTLRVIKYQPFLQAWQQDAPALGLYQPQLLYLTNGPVAGLTDHTINTPTDRFDNVQNWEIRQAKVTD
jgi:peptide/nickel transport system substrate-binding protein